MPVDDVERAEVVQRAADLGRDEPDLLLVQVARVDQVEPAMIVRTGYVKACQRIIQTEWISFCI